MSLGFNPFKYHKATREEAFRHLAKLNKLENVDAEWKRHYMENLDELYKTSLELYKNTKKYSSQKNAFTTLLKLHKIEDGDKEWKRLSSEGPASAISKENNVNDKQEMTNTIKIDESNTSLVTEDLNNGDIEIKGVFPVDPKNRDSFVLNGAITM